MIFDPTLTWGLHIKALIEKCQKPLSILQYVANRNWGADRKSLINLYLAIIQSKINYGDFIYGSASKTNIEQLDVVQHKSLKMISGNIRCTPGFTLEPETNILPLAYKRNLNGLKYMSRVYRIDRHPTKLCFQKGNGQVNFMKHFLSWKELGMRKKELFVAKYQSGLTLQY